MDINKLISKEVWKRHPVLSEIECSSFGRVRVNGKYLKGCVDRKGYMHFGFKNKQYNLHRMVWECFNGIIPDGYVIDHINAIRQDNHIENLKCCTPAENNDNPITKERQLKAKREKSGKKVLKKDKWSGEILGYYESVRQAGIENKILPQYIRWVCNGKKGYNSAGGFKWEWAKYTYSCKWGKWWISGDIEN